MAEPEQAIRCSFDEVATAKLAADCEVKQCPVAHPPLAIEEKPIDQICFTFSARRPAYLYSRPADGSRLDYIVRYP